MKDISPQDRSIRNIEVRHKHPRPEPPPPAPKAPRKPRRSKRIWWLALVIIIIAAALGLLLSTVFAGATLTITPRTAAVTLPPTILAALNAPVGTLPYQTLTVMQSATTTVAAKGTENVQKQASGTITITNTFSSASQRLIANTRFQAPDGKIYRIHDSVVVPGIKGSLSGQVSVTAYADSAGPDYNRTGTTGYTIPGFNGDPRFTKITATSGPMTGGFVGTEPSVAPADLQSAQTKLEQQLSTAIDSTLVANLPDGYEIITGTTAVSYGSPTQTAAGSDSASISETATGNAAIVRVNDLAAAVAKQTVTGYADEPVTFDNPSAVTVSASSTAQTTTLQLQLGGSANLVWVFDPNALKTALVGKQKSDFESIIKSFEPAIASADASIRPFWTSNFPTDPNKISITVVITQ
jgi:hypothetical protein